MSLKKILADAFSGGRGEPRGTFTALLDEIKRVATSRRAAGRAAGIGESTLRGWDKGKRPRDPAGAVAKLRRGLRKLWRTDPGTSVRVTIANPGSGPPFRTVKVSPDAMARAGDAWERGDHVGMVREFRAGIADDWYRKEMFRPQPGDDDVGDDEDEDSQEGWDMEQSNPYPEAVSWR